MSPRPCAFGRERLEVYPISDYCSLAALASLVYDTCSRLSVTRSVSEAVLARKIGLKPLTQANINFTFVNSHTPLSVAHWKNAGGSSAGVDNIRFRILVAVLLTGNWNFINPLFLVLVVLNCLVFAGLGVIVGLSVRSQSFDYNLCC